MASSSSDKLRLITYLAPNSMPVEYYQSIQYYLEEQLKCDSFLIYESRYDGPPQGKPDPFTLDEVDIAFLSSSYFAEMKKNGNKSVELLPVGAIIEHVRGANRPVYFADVIVHSENKKKFEKFELLKGHNWAYSHSKSKSGCLVLLEHLKKMGTNASFFGNTLESGSHIGSIRMVLDGTVEAASVSSTCLKNFLRQNPEYRDQISVLTSWGPLPIHPIAVNSKMPVEKRQKIAKLLLEMAQDDKWRDELGKFFVQGFLPIEESMYLNPSEDREDKQPLSMKAVYY